MVRGLANNILILRKQNSFLFYKFPRKYFKEKEKSSENKKSKKQPPIYKNRHGSLQGAPVDEEVIIQIWSRVIKKWKRR